MLQENKNKKIIEALPVLSFQAFLSEVIYTPQPVHQLSEIQEFGENYKNNPKSAKNPKNFNCNKWQIFFSIIT